MPDTLNDMLLGYALGLAILFLLVASIWWRYRRLAADEAALAALADEEEAASVPAKKDAMQPT
jgi:cbb3-type cytochrome oxidase subunit 3